MDIDANILVEVLQEQRDKALNDLAMTKAALIQLQKEHATPTLDE